MGHRHNTLNDTIFRNSRYIKFLNENLGIEVFRKEYKEQYDFILDTFSTLILLNNCFFSDSNLGMTDKVNNAIKICGKYLYSDFNEDTLETESENGTNKYSVRFIQSILEKHSTHVYRRITEWYLDYLDNYTTSSNISFLLEDIEKEMATLENINFDDMVKDTIDYKKNKNSNHRIFICKFDSLYSSFMEFTQDFREDYDKNHITPISDEELSNVSQIYRLMTKCSNGLTKVIENEPIEEYRITERTTPNELFKMYLDSLDIGLNIYDFKMEALTFMYTFSEILGECKSKGLDNSSTLHNFDFFYFDIQMKQLLDDKDLTITDELIRKDFEDLKEVYNTIHTKPTCIEDSISISIKASNMLKELMEKKRIQNYFVRVS